MASPNYSAVFLPSVQKDLDALDKAFIDRFFAWVSKANTSPTNGCKCLRHVSQSIWVRRLGRLRVMFLLNKKEQELRILKVDLRNDDTYSDLPKLLKVAENYFDPRL